MRKKFMGSDTPPLITLLACLTLPLYAQTDEPIGTGLATKGRAEVRATDGTFRTVARRSPIYLQDTILVGSDGYVQRRMVDDAGSPSSPIPSSGSRAIPSMQIP